MVILEQDDGFIRYPTRQLFVFSPIPWIALCEIVDADHRVGNQSRRIEHAKFDHDAVDATQVPVNVLFGDQLLRQCVLDRLFVVVEKLVDPGMNGSARIPTWRKTSAVT